MYKVMIVDDVEVFRLKIMRLKIWGEKSGFIVTDEAVDGLDALQKLEMNSVDLVITDIRMPNMDGIELLRNIFEKKLCTYIVLLSDFTEYNYARQGFLYNAFDYLGKPVDEKELIKLLERIRQQLDEKKQEMNKIIELNEMIEDTIYTATEVNQIIYMICQGDKKAIELTTSMVNTIGSYFDNDILKAQLILKNTINKIIDEAIKINDWLPLYYNINQLKNTEFENCTDWTEIKSIFNYKIEKLIEVNIKFIGSQNTGITYKICLYILEKVNEKLSISIICNQFYISKSQLCDIFKKKLGITLLEYITMVKMERAKILLNDDNKRYYEIANDLGFHDEDYFSKVFKKYVGMSLAEFRNK